MKHFTNRKLVNKRDAIIISIILFIGLIFMLCSSLFSSQGNVAIVAIDGNTIKKIALSKDETITLKEIPNVVLEISNGKIRVKTSDCPDKICVNTGYISKSSEKIVCLPNKLTVQIESEE